MDRCALFVDASYVLADGALAVHGTRNRASASWDYVGLVKLLGGICRESTGVPLLRCYWYDTAAEGEHSGEHDALADLPGVKLRLGKVRAGRKEGAAAEMARDLGILARNRAVSDVVIVSAEEDLAPVIAEVQDLGIRAVLLQIAGDGPWAVSRTLRQEFDDTAQMSAAHLRPYVDLIPGAETAAGDGNVVGPGYRELPAGGAHAGRPEPQHVALQPAAQLYSPPVASDYDPMTQAGLAPAPGHPGPVAPVAPAPVAQPTAQAGSGPAQAGPEGMGGGQGGAPTLANGLGQGAPANGLSQPTQAAGLPGNGSGQVPPAGGLGSGLPGRLGQGPVSNGAHAQGGLNGLPQGGLSQNGVPLHAGQLGGTSGTSQPGQAQPSQPQPPGPQHAAPTPPAGMQGLARQEAPVRQPPGGQWPGSNGMHYPEDSGGQYVGQVQPGQYPAQPAQVGYQGAPYHEPQPPAGPHGGAAAVSVGDAVQAAHAEGFGFGEAVARDAPALWLEAVLARKPRMPSDLEARLLQGSALPIDSLLHDEVRHALRRGFWDALERSRH